MGFLRQEYWSVLPCPPPGDLPDPGMEPMSFMSPVLAGRVFTPKASWESLKFYRGQQKLLSPLSLFVLVYFSILPFSGPAVHDSIILEKYKIATLYFKSIP